MCYENNSGSHSLRESSVSCKGLDMLYLDIWSFLWRFVNTLAVSQNMSNLHFKFTFWVRYYSDKLKYLLAKASWSEALPDSDYLSLLRYLYLLWYIVNTRFFGLLFYSNLLRHDSDICVKKCWVKPLLSKLTTAGKARRRWANFHTPGS